ncbi:BrxE family protein [Gammaproteobacteria bacterium]
MMTHSHLKIDLDRLLKLRLVVARFGEMDAARWWNTGGLLGSRGALLMGRGFPRTHLFTQARVVFAVARSRGEELLQHPGAKTLWSLPAEIEDRFDSRWGQWLEEMDTWREFFRKLESAPSDLLLTFQQLQLISPDHREALGRLRRSAEGRAVLLTPGKELDDDTITVLATAFSLGEPGKPAIPYTLNGGDDG